MTRAATKGTRITGQARAALTDQMKKRYASGESIRSLADESGRSYGFVHRILSESGTPLRRRGGAGRAQRQKP